jgi:diaminopimelate decarboxylase
MGAGVLIERPALLETIARRAGTPVYVYDAASIRSQYGALATALADRPHRIFYSVKASSSLAILGLLRRLGAGVDVVSVGELARAFHAGFRASDIVFSGVGKRQDELEQAVTQRIHLVNVESIGEFRSLEAVAERRGIDVRMGIRINPDVDVATHPYTRTGRAGLKFGVPLDEVSTLVEMAQASRRVRLVALGMHIGSQILDAAAFRRAAERLVTVIEEVRALGVDTLEIVDAGGGIGIRYQDEVPMTAAEYAAALRPLTDETGLALAVEPGRFLVGDAGVLLTRCLYLKRSGGTTFAIVDGAMNDLMRPSLYDAAHGVQVVTPGPYDVAGPDAVVDVVGPVCESGDFLARGRRVPGVGPGALVAVTGVGAYGFSMSSTYNSRPRPAEVVVDGDRWVVIRARETLEDLMRGETPLDQLDSGDAWSSVTRAAGRAT